MGKCPEVLEGEEGRVPGAVRKNILPGPKRRLSIPHPNWAAIAPLNPALWTRGIISTLILNCLICKVGEGKPEGRKWKDLRGGLHSTVQSSKTELTSPRFVS